jgi:hypothetical protein
LRRPAPQQVVHAHQPGHLQHPCVDHGIIRRRLGAQREGDVLGDGQVRVEREVLEDHRDPALPRGQAVDRPAIEEYRALGRRLQPRHDPQDRRLATTRRPQEYHELALGDLEVHPVDGGHVAVVHLGHALERDGRHLSI